MIKAKHDGTYKEVGFIKVRQPDGTYKDVEKRYSKTPTGEHKLVFEKGFTREVEGALPLSLNGIGKDLKDYTIEGNTEQESYSGKNLINIIPFKTTFGTGSAVIRDFLNSLDTGVYVVSYNTELLTRDDTTDTSIYGIRVINEMGNFELTPNWGSANVGTIKKTTLKITITNDNKGKFVNVYFYGCGTFSAGVTGSAQVYDFQLELGSEVTSYEPYVGGIPSPNPDYPQEVVGCGDKTGNLINANAIVKGRLDDGVLGYGEETTELIVSGNIIKCTTAKAWRGFVTDFIPVEQGRYFLYHIATPNDITYAYRVSVYDSQKNFALSRNPNERAITINEGEAFIRVSYQLGVAGTFEISNIMLSEGSTALPYEPYGYKIPVVTAAEDGTESITTPIYLDKPLYKIGDYTDTLNYTGQKVERVVKELVLTGVENWYYSSAYDVENTVRFHSDSLLANRQETALDLCSHFERLGYNSLNVANKMAFSTANKTQLVFRVSKTDCPTANDFKSYLAAQYANGTPVTVYYILAEPETESVELPAIPTIDGTTVIDVDTEVKPSEISVKYKSKT